MVLSRKILLCVVVSLSAMTALANEPRIGYLYPAGGQQGTVVQIIAGGQFLRGAHHVYISGEGVTANVVKYMRGFNNLNGDQRKELQKRLKELRDKRITELPPAVRAEMFPQKKPVKKTRPKKEESKKDEAKNTEEEKPPVKLPAHPLLEDLDSKSLRELAHISDQIFMPRSKLQPNRQLAEMVIIEITIAPDAKPGFRELRIGARNGLTNPMVFQVGMLPETREMEPNNTQAYEKIRELPKLPRPEPLTLPVVLNGQIRPGDVDRFRFHAQKGQKLVIETHARSLIPYLADAVPGWFQATITLYTASGSEMAFADDYRFNPDPVLFYEITRDGNYELEICDAIYRGREDFVYRVAIGERPFITQMFPLGGKENSKTVAAIDGWNLPEKKLLLDTALAPAGIRKTAYQDDKQVSNVVPYAVDTLPECTEKEANNNLKTAQTIDLPMIVNGRIATAGDVDIFRFTGQAGDEITAEVYARRLNSPLDALLRLTDATGKVIDWNDDHVVKDSYLHKDIVGLTTHHADSYLVAKLPKAGTYYVHLADSQHHGGDAFGYRLHVGPKQPDFAIRVTPSSLTIPAGSVVPVTVHVLRKNGFDGEIDVALKDAPDGFKLEGGRIPAGCNRIRMTLAGPLKPLNQPVELKLQASANVTGKTMTRVVVPAEDRMQAFLYRHLVPSEQWLVAVPKKRWRMPPIEIADTPVKIPAGGSVQITLKTRKRPLLKEIQLQLQNPPEGLSLHDVTVVPEGLAFTVKAEKEALAPGFADNLIIETFREYMPKPKEGKPAPKKRRDSMGVIRAIPIRIIGPQEENKSEASQTTPKATTKSTPNPRS